MHDPGWVARRGFPPANLCALPRPMTAKARTKRNRMAKYQTRRARGKPHLDSGMRAVESARNAPIETVVRDCGLSLKRQAQYLVGPCPRCGGHDRFNVHLKKQSWFCRRCDTGGGVIQLVMHIDGCDFWAAVRTLNGTASWSRPAANAAPSPSPSVASDEAPNFAEAMSFWGEAVDPRGTPVIPYLNGRKTPLPVEAIGETIRYHPACKFGLHRIPCMVALVRNILTNKPQAIHRTAIDLKGNKMTVDGWDRLTLAPTRGGAIKLVPDDMVRNCLGIGEGIESTLSMRLAPEFGVSPVWSVLSDGGISKFPVLLGVERLWIGVDNDLNGVGQRAATECSSRWTAAGREVFRITSKKPGEDLNDLVRWASCVP
jgi:Toprim domain/CHC2 zinc finger